MRDISRRIFRHMPEAALLKAEREPVYGRGTVERLKAEGGSHTAGERHGTGRLCAPLFVFTGSLDGAAVGDALEQDGQRYTVLKVGRLCAAGTVFGVRLVMERQVAEHDGV